MHIQKKAERDEEQSSDADKDSKRGVPDSFYVAQLKDAEGLQRMVIRL